jgi:group II intron reverse transcriptase/maturase
MQIAESILNIYQERGRRGLPLERVYRQLFNPELYLRAYGKIYRNAGATTRGTTDDTVDGMSMGRIHRIIELLRQEKYRWNPVRRVEIPKPKGGTRPLGIPSWSDKLLQEVLRELLSTFYEPRFSDCSHGFRPERGCHSALSEIQRTWHGTVWFIEGDISKCFDSFDHDVLLSILRRNIQDERLIRLIEHLLKAGYMEDWRFNETLSGTPQGGIISPLLSNIYLNELDDFVENTLIPAYTNGKKRGHSREYIRLNHHIAQAKKKGDMKRAALLKRQRRTIPSCNLFDPTYRRLRYVRYADDFLLGFAGSKKEAEEIRDKLSDFLGQKLNLKLSTAKTLITHAVEDKAKFLGYEVAVTRNGDLLGEDGGRNTNGRIGFLMPVEPVRKIERTYCKNGKAAHYAPLLHEAEYTIVQRYQAVYRGLYNYFCTAYNVSTRMGRIRWVLESSLAKTLASKLKISVNQVFRLYKKTAPNGLKALSVSVKREGKLPLVATFGGFSLSRTRVPSSLYDMNWTRTWEQFSNRRTELVTRLLNDKCELCGKDGDVEVHHIRKLADIDRPGRRPKSVGEKIMSARRRKTLVVCSDCHDEIHAGRYDGPRF